MLEIFTNVNDIPTNYDEVASPEFLNALQSVAKEKGFSVGRIDGIAGKPEKSIWWFAFRPAHNKDAGEFRSSEYLHKDGSWHPSTTRPVPAGEDGIPDQPTASADAAAAEVASAEDYDDYTGYFASLEDLHRAAIAA